jgi:hypothetical protein
VSMLTLLLSIALADEPVAPVPAGPEAATTSLPPLTSDATTLSDGPAPMSAEQLLDEAWHRIDLRDYEGTRIVAEQVIARDAALKPRATAAIAASYEYDGDPERALGMYRAILDADPSGDLAPHMHMRIAECLGAVGKYTDALAELAILGDPAKWPYLDEKKIRLLGGSWQLASGDRTGGTLALGEALAGMGPDEDAYYQALARAAIAKDLVAQADTYEFGAKEKRTVKALKARTALILQAEDQVVAAIDLKEPEWALEGLLVLGGAYERVGDDLLTVPPSKKLKTPEQRELYATTLKERVQILYVKSARYDEQGIDLATRLLWKSHRIAELETALAEVRTKITPAATP